jgi:uncharacterized membrane protein YjjB (DUF3815 family)
MGEIALAFVGSLSAGIIYNVKRNNLLWVGLSGACGWIFYILLKTYTGDIIVATFVGAVAVGLYSESMARLIKAPATVFTISGIFPLVPGIGAYTTVQYIVENRLVEAASKGVETITSALSIAFGLMLVFAFFRLFGSKEKKGKC